MEEDQIQANIERHKNWLSSTALDAGDKAVIEYVQKKYKEIPVKKKRTASERIWECSECLIMLPHNYNYFEIYPKAKIRYKAMETFITY